jgi:deoxyribodipyrimidine photo-lyase
VGGVAEVTDYRGGSREAMRRLRQFVRDRLPRYASERNEPTPYCTSELSAHLHFGHISPITIALSASGSEAPRASVVAYLEELIVCRELSVNFVARNPEYDRLAGCPASALETLAEHAGDRRPVPHVARQLEDVERDDPLWNAAQDEMMLTGRNLRHRPVHELREHPQEVRLRGLHRAGRRLGAGRCGRIVITAAWNT